MKNRNTQKNGKRKRKTRREDQPKPKGKRFFFLWFFFGFTIISFPGLLSAAWRKKNRKCGPQPQPEIKFGKKIIIKRNGRRAMKNEMKFVFFCCFFQGSFSFVAFDGGTATTTPNSVRAFKEPTANQSVANRFRFRESKSIRRNSQTIKIHPT